MMECGESRCGVNGRGNIKYKLASTCVLAPPGVNLEAAREYRAGELAVTVLGRTCDKTDAVDTNHTRTRLHMHVFFCDLVQL